MENEQAPLLGRAGHARNFRNHRSHPPRSKQRTRLALAAVLLSETFERIAFYGVIGNLVMFLNEDPFHWKFYNATNALFMFTGISYMSSLLGGWLADSCLGKFATILISYCIYICGSVFFPLLIPHPDISENVTTVPAWCAPTEKYRNGSHESQNLFTFAKDDPPTWRKVIASTMRIGPGSEPCAWAVYLALGVMAVGNGAVKANISPFGAEQVKHEGPAAVRMFVNWYYWCINIGALIALGGVAYVQQEISFFWGYIATNISIIISVIIFVSGFCMYIRRPAGGSILTNITKVLCQSWRKCCCRRRPQTSGLLSGSPALYSDIPPSCLDYAKIQYGGSFHDNMVDDVKTLGKICMIFLAMIPYWVVYFQMETTFVVQGLHMRLDFDSNGTKAEAEARNFKIPTAWLSLFDVIFLVILLPLFDRVIYPKLDQRGYVLSPRLRIVFGMIFSMLAVIVAGVLEWYRLRVYWAGDKENIHWQMIGTTFYRASDVTILLQIPQYALIGVSEVFASVAGLELAYVLAPRSMQGLITGLFWMTSGLGSMLGTAVIFGFRGVWFFTWDQGDINCRVKCPSPSDPTKLCACHLDYYFFFLAGLQVIGIVIFIIIAWGLDIGLQSAYQKITPQEATDSQEGSTVVPAEGTTRPGYRSIYRRPASSISRQGNNAPSRADSQISETDTLDTDHTSDYNTR